MTKIVIFFAAISLVACGSNADQSPQKQVATVELSADIVLDHFRSNGLPIENAITLTSKTDSNRLLGRPAQYTSKVNFFDDRYPNEGEEGDTGNNTIEVFQNPSDALTRKNYIESVTKGVPFLLQYQILKGRILVRLDKALTPEEVAEYQKSLQSLPIK